MTRPTKIVVFAHVPPPRHGQSLMVRLMLDGFGGDCARGGSPAGGYGVACYHVDARVSDDLADVGGMRPGKLWRLLQLVGRALLLRFRFGADALYYIPAPAKRSAILRDLMALCLLRPWFRRIILHWHAVGLGAWVSGAGPRLFGPFDRIARAWMKRCLADADPAIGLSEAWKADAEVFRPRRVVVVPNGLPDPFPEGPAPKVRQDGFRALFFAMGTREKGIFEALQAFVLFSGRVGQGVALSVAGEFPDPEVGREFRARLEEHVRAGRLAAGQVYLAGHLDAAAKREAFLSHDCLLVPSKHESFGLTLLDAMAAGIEIAGSDLGPFREILGELAEGRLVPSGDELALAGALVRAMSRPDPGALRARYIGRFTAAEWLGRLSAALREPSGGAW